MQRIARRLGLRDRAAYVPTEVLDARARVLWKHHPGFTAQQLIARMGPDYPVGIVRAWTVVKRCRESAAQRSWAQARWLVDRFTVTRIRISGIWTCHPEFTAQQVIPLLGTEQPVRIPWVQKILHDCWRAAARHSPTQRRVGRRFYHAERARHRGATRG